MSEARPLHKIADDIMRKWRNPAGSAIPYINALTHLGTMDSKYGHEDAEGIVLRFLNEASGWRGEDAKRIKAELRAMLPKRSRR
jgi:hypothetical protein